MSQASYGRRAVAVCCSVVFTLAIFLPMTVQVLKLDTRQKVAEAGGQGMPELDWRWKSLEVVVQLFTQGWLDRNFGFRGDLIRWYNYASAKVFGSMSSSAPVVVGRQGWLFLAKDQNRDVMEEHRAVHPLRPEQMEAIKRVYEERQAWLAQRGIRYLVAVAPNKDTIYPEFLPPEYEQVGPVSRLDQLMDYLDHNSSLNVLDLRQTLRQAKKDIQVFYSTDSHWNAFGAFPCYQAIINRLAADFPGLKPMDMSQFTPERFTYLGGDLSYLVGLEGLVTEDRVYLLPKRPLAARAVSLDRFVPGYITPAQASEKKDPHLPKAVFFHDSYFWEIQPFLGEDFSRAVYVWVRPWVGDKPQFFDKELIEAEHPDVVVEEIAERFFIPQSQNQPAGAGQ